MSKVGSTAGTTYVIELTPAGRAAVSVVLVAGPEAESAVDHCFHPVGGRSLCETPVGRILLGRWGSSEGEELVACRRSANQIEIHCHGGVAAVDAVIARLLDQDCQQISWTEWLRHSSRDPIRSAAQIALAEAPTVRTATILLDQFHGALAAAMQQAAAFVATGNWPQAAATINSLETYRGVGMHLTTPWRVVLAGPTNVGKSSLINALAGFERAIVSQYPGTTRDVVTTMTAMDGWPIELADTAGLRPTVDELESAGIALATGQIAEADLVLLIRDASESMVCDATASDALDAYVLQLPDVARVLHVKNKIDLIASEDRRVVCRGNRDGNLAFPILTSALTGEGIAELIAQIGRSLVPHAPPASAAVPFAAGQFAVLEAARLAIERRDAKLATSALRPLLPT